MPDPSCATPACTIERLGCVVTDLGECPVWQDGRLWLLDCRQGRLLALDADTGTVRADLQAPPPLGSFAVDAGGELVVALREEIVALDPATGLRRVLGRIDASAPHLRLNDGTALPDGSFVVGTMHVNRGPGEPPAGGLYRLGTDGALRRLAEGIAITNGPGVNPVNGRFHVADTEARTIHSYRIEADGSLSDRRLFADTRRFESGADGCCFDTSGGLWAAMVRAGRLVRFDLDGRPTHEVHLPVTYPTALCFGGAGMDTLFVTSIRDSGRLRADGPLDGAVLRVRGLGFRGLPRPLTRVVPPSPSPACGRD